MGEVAALLTAYNQWQNLPEPEEEVTLELPVQYVPKEEPVETAPAEPVPEEPSQVETPEEPQQPAEVVQPEQPEKKSAFEWWMVLVALGVFALGGGALKLLNPAKLKETYEKKYEDRAGSEK